MAQLKSKAADSLSPLLVFCGSVAILVHLGAVTVHALAAQSGPWPGPDGPSQADPPSFAQALDSQGAAGYLKLVKLTHNYHFAGNYPLNPGVFLEATFKDAHGDPIAVRFPDPEANPWVRHLQEVFVQGLASDLPVAPLEGETVPAPNKQVRTLAIWDQANNDSLRLRHVQEHLIPRNRPVEGPSEWSLVLVHSYARYLCRKYGATSVEVVRHHREPLPPAAMLSSRPPPFAFKEMLSNYGEIHGD
jgi:hypothetical protein